MMNNVIKRFKCILVFSIMIVYNVTSYAAVSSNDGSAFVTKAEFDAMVNTFNEQMDDYANSLVSKVDGAIANYLTGLASNFTVPQTSLLNKLNKWSFRNNWDIFRSWNTKSQLGTYLEYEIYVSAMAALSRSDENSRGYEWSAHANGGQRSSTGSGYSYYVLTKDSTYDASKKIITGILRSYPISSFRGSFQNGSWWNGVNETPSYLSPYTIDASHISGTSFGTGAYNLTGTIFGYTITVPATITFTKWDNILTDVDSNMYISSGTVSATDPIYIVQDTQINERDTSIQNYGYSNDGWCKAYYKSNLKYNGKSPYYSMYGIAGYRHKYTTIPAATGYTYFINDDISTVAGEETGYYNGLPIFTATDTGVARVDFTITGDAGSTNSFEISDTQFSNTEITPGLSKLFNASCYYVDSAGNIVKDVYKVPTGRPIHCEFNAKKGETYWIKIQPGGTFASVSTSNIDIYVE